MYELKFHSTLARRTQELAAWQRGAIGLLAASAVINAASVSSALDLRRQVEDQAEQLKEVERTRDYAVEQLGAMARQMEADKQARIEQAAAYESVGAYQYVGACTVTAYCPCETCCGQWADGLTATGLPAMPGIVAVDPEVIPLGSTVVIDGQKYLAADTGVTGLHVDVCATSHQEAESFGVQTAEVWVAP